MAKAKRAPKPEEPPRANPFLTAALNAGPFMDADMNETSALLQTPEGREILELRLRSHRCQCRC